MSAPCEILEWDSQFFGYRIGRATVDKADQQTAAAITEWCEQNHIDCLYFLSHADDFRTSKILSAHCFDLVDIRMTFEIGLCGWQRFSPTLELRPCKQEDVHQLKSIAAESYRASRFYFDPRFPTELCDKLYMTWVEKSCNGYAEHVIIAEIDTKAVGFATCLIKEQYGHIGLVGVDAQVRGMGIGQELVKAALQWLHDHNCERANVVTQGRNIAAQRLYQRCGLIIQSVRLWYHYWK